MAGSVTGIILVFLGGFLVMLGARGVVSALRSLGWRRVPGTIGASGVQTYSGRVGRSGGGHGRTQFAQATVAYTYEVDGQSYTGTRETFARPLGYGGGFQGVAASHAARHTAGDAVDVWVDPSNPSDSVLQRVSARSLVFFAGGAALAVTGVLSL